jgi:hypothetical protein
MYLTAGGAAALVAGTLVVWSVAWDDGCKPSCSPAQIDGFRMRSYIGDGLWAGGGAAAALGLVLWLRPQGHGARAWVTPTLSGAALGGTF